MKRIITFLLLLVAGMSVSLRAEEPEVVGILEDDGKTLKIIKYFGASHTINSEHVFPDEWMAESFASQRAKIEKVIFYRNLNDNYLRLKSTAHWFDGFSSLTTLEGLEYFRPDQVTDMSYMFRNCTSLGKFVNLYFFTTGEVTSMKGMFQNCSSIETMYLPDFDMSKVTDASEMFSGCTQLTTIRCARDWSEGTFKDDDMFKGCTKLRGDAGTPTLFDAAHTGKEYARLDGGTARPGYFTTEYSNYGVFNLNDRTFTIYYGSETDRISRGGVLAYKWDSDDECRDSKNKVSTIILDESMQSYRPTSLYRYFGGFEWVRAIENLAYLNTSEVTDMSYAFSWSGRHLLKSLDLRTFDVHNVKDFTGMFYVNEALETIYCNDDWSKIPAKSDYMFSACSKLVGGEGTIKSSIDNASYARPDEGESKPGYFTASNSETEIYGVISYDNRTFTIYYNANRPTYGGLTPEMWMDNEYASKRANVDKVVFDYSMTNALPTSTAHWFDGFTSLTELKNINYLHTGAVTDMSYMFRNCTSLGKGLNLYYFSTENVTSMKGMFQNCSSANTIYLPDFDMSKVTDASEMFSGCTQLTTLSCGWDWSKGTYKDDDMFKGCTKLKGDAGTPTLFNSAHTGKEYARPDGGTANPGYFTAEYSNYGVFSPDGKTFTVYYDTKRAARGGILFEKWDDEKYASARIKVEKAVIDESMKSYHPTSFYAWFKGFANMTEVEHLDYLNTSEVTTMEQMFDGCTSLKTIDLRTFDTQKVTSFYAMFRNCSYLKTIYCSEDWGERNATATYLFEGCISLTGGAGTTYISEPTGKELFLAHPDKSGKMGYFTMPESDYPELYANLSDDRKTMTIYYDKRRPCVDGVTDWSVYKNIAWDEKTKNNRITKIVIDKTVKDFTPTTTEAWFSAFRYVKSIVNLEYLNTSQVTNMHNMFANCDSLVDMSVSNFDTKNVTDMSGMFSGCGKLRKLDVSNFNTSNVTDMFYMFGGCRNLTSISCDNFDTRNVTDMSYMFAWCKYAFPLNVSNFDTRNVTDMSYMFYGCKYETSIDVSHFNTSNVTNMYCMFAECRNLRQLDLRSFDVSKVTKMPYMFENDSSLITLFAGQDWGAIAPLEKSNGMFYGCPKLRGGAGTVYSEANVDAAYARPDEEGKPGYFTTVAEIYATWDADNTTLTLRYDDKREENGGTTNWALYNYLATQVVFDPSMKKAEPTSTKDWFYGFSQLETIEHLDYLSTYRVKDMSYMFSGCSKLTTINVNSFYLSWAETTEGMFSYCINLTTIWCDHNWNEQLYDKNSKDMFLGCTNLVGGKGTAYDANYTSSTRACTDSNLRYGYFSAIPEGAVDLSGNEVYAVLEADNKTLTIRYGKDRVSRGGVTFWYKYSSAAGSYKIETVVFDPSVADAKPISTEGWFQGFSDLTSITGLEYLNTEYVTDMTNMFRDCSSLTELDVTNFNTQNVTNMGFMFSGCTSLKALDLSHFDTRKVSILYNMFEDCESLTELDIRQFETDGVTDMTMLFAGCKHLEALDVTALKTGKVVDMMGMFYQCEKLTELDVSGFDMSSITSLMGMFYGCKSLKTILCNDDWSKMPSLAYHNDMFTDCPELVGGNNTVYSASNDNDVSFAHVDGGESDPGYFTSYPGEIYGVYSTTGDTLTLYYHEKKIERKGCDWTLSTYYDQNTKVKTVIFDETIKEARPTSCHSWFAHFTQLRRIEHLDYLNTAEVTDMNYMFSNCYLLTYLDLRTLDFSKVQSAYGMFTDCINLRFILCNDEWKGSGPQLYYDNMFYNFSTEVPVTFYYVLDEETGVMTFYYDNLLLESKGELIPWNNGFYWEPRMLKVKTAVFDESVKEARLTSLSGLFKQFEHMTAIEHLDYLNTSEVTNMSYMFSGCDDLTSLDIRSFDISKVTNTDWMFALSTSLKTIYCNEDWSKSETIQSSSAMFFACVAIEGDHGTVYDNDYQKIAYARPDGGTDAPGYFTRLFTVTFTDKDGNILSVVDVRDGESAEAPEAPAVEGYIFSGWDKDISSVHEDLTAKAQYEDAVKYYTVTLVAENGKIITDEYIDLTAVESGTVLLLTALPDYGYTLDHWENYNPETGLLVTGNITVTAYFVPQVFTLTVVAEPAEGGTFILGGVDENRQAAAMSDYTIEAVPNEGYEFVEWRDGNEVLDNKTTKMSGALYGDITITGVFKLKQDIETGIDEAGNQTPQAESTKIIRNGILYILRGGKTYNAQGQRVQ